MDMQNLEVQIDELKAQVEALNKQTAENKLAMIVFSGDLDKVLAAFVIATGSVAMGMDVVPIWVDSFRVWTAPGQRSPSPTPTARAAKIQRVRYRSRKERRLATPPRCVSGSETG